MAVGRPARAAMVRARPRAFVRWPMSANIVRWPMDVGEKQVRKTDGRQVRGSRVVYGYGSVAGGGLRRAGGPRGRCMGGRRTGLASWRSSGGQRIGLWARGSTGGRKEGLRVRGGATREDTEEERESTVDDSSLRRGDRDAGNCTSHVHNPQLAVARDNQRAVDGLDLGHLVGHSGGHRRLVVVMVVGCSGGRKTGPAAQTLIGGQQQGLQEGGGGQVEEKNDEGDNTGGAAALHAAIFGLQEDGGAASGDFCVGVFDGPTTPPRAVVVAMAMAIVAAAAAAAAMARAMAKACGA